MTPKSTPSLDQIVDQVLGKSLDKASDFLVKSLNGGCNPAELSDVVAGYVAMLMEDSETAQSLVQVVAASPKDRNTEMAEALNASPIDGINAGIVRLAITNNLISRVNELLREEKGLTTPPKVSEAVTAETFFNHLSVMAHVKLDQNGIRTVEMLSGYTEAGLLKSLVACNTKKPKKILKEIKKLLEEIGLSLKSDTL